MKRYFDFHDEKNTIQIDVVDGSPAASASGEELFSNFSSNDIREITLSQYRRLTIQYDK